MRLGGIAAIALVAMGCHAGSAAQPRPEDPDRASGGITSERMEHHFEHSLRARDALVRGDVSGARRAARELARAEAEPRLRGAHLDAMRTAARAVASSAELDATALAFGEVALACGTCHRAMGVAIEQPEPPRPRGDDPRARMQQHLWAADRLWEGLALPDERRFAAGAAALAEAPLHPATGATAQTVAPEVRAIADRVRELAREGRAASDGATRARAYGAVLGTCADCHRRVGVGGPAAPVEL